MIMLCVMTAIFVAPLLWTSALRAAALLWPACTDQAPSDLQQRRYWRARSFSLEVL